MPIASTLLPVCLKISVKARRSKHCSSFSGKPMVRASRFWAITAPSNEPGTIWVTRPEPVRNAALPPAAAPPASPGSRPGSGHGRSFPYGLMDAAVSTGISPMLHRGKGWPPLQGPAMGAGRRCPPPTDCRHARRRERPHCRFSAAREGQRRSGVNSRIADKAGIAVDAGRSRSGQNRPLAVIDQPDHRRRQAQHRRGSRCRKLRPQSTRKRRTIFIKTRSRSSHHLTFRAHRFDDGPIFSSGEGKFRRRIQAKQPHIEAGIEQMAGDHQVSPPLFPL